MAIRVALNHLTRYQFDKPVSVYPHVVRLRPAPHSRTTIESYSLTVRPEGEYFINWQQDPFGNYLARLVFPEKIKSLEFEVDLVAEMVTINPFDFFLEEGHQHYPMTYEKSLAKDLSPYLHIDEDGPLLREWLTGVDRSKKEMIDFLVEVNQRLEQDISYSIRMEVGVQSCEETLKRGIGSCRDSAWLLVQILRHLGLAARFVSGYLVQLTADVKSLDGPSGPTTDFTDLHAWTEVYLPGAGWVGLDPTSGLFASEGHIPLACTPDTGSAAPITGATDECEVEFYFHNEIERVHEDPRVTKPYTDDQWHEIDALGEQVDADLKNHDVRLTLGGEPTFVSIDDMESAQWNTAALGDHKSELADKLLRRLKQRFTNGALLHYGQGKWYPGEPLPRWALNCYWRKDGEPVWKNPDLLADDTRAYHYETTDAERFIKTLATRLDVAEYVIPAYEDPFFHTWQEQRIPPNLDPLQYDLKEPLERRRISEILQHGLDNPVGYVLPLKWDWNGYWRSSDWPLRQQRLYLMPGDSPLGLRLPLDSLPWIAAKKRPLDDQPQSTFEVRAPLVNDTLMPYLQPVQTVQRIDPEPPEIYEGFGEVVHTAMDVEARGGRLYVFMPPMTSLEQWLALVSHIEATATELNMPVFIEGYTPPRDSRLLKFSVTPDPGVIEVNVHPANNWQELVEDTEALYEEAHLCRLGTEKFMLDGRHTGTGGGNHVTLGGATPADSPFLRRPDLLASILTYWQHHPSLSYLFSGMFIGPTSQAPRVDEARHENLYELEIALQQIPVGETPEPWLVDRIFRHLLTDLTGNTHRAEICIDKLYSPDHDAGRLGLVEMRAFEMPPHARMSLVQMLLLRSLIARFWKTPYRHRLVRWRTELHDRFMLRHYVQQDIFDVVRELQEAGYPFKEAWLDPFIEFRFPHYGTVNVQDLRLDLHMAIEPWHVLGEEASNVGTARFVDSSVERLQIRVSGMTDTRHLVLCNGRRLPLRSTGVEGEYVAGVRFRAWQPPSALHPRIGIHAPLVFDVVDSWNKRVIGGCTYHVSHPGGRSYDVFPVNALAAETRRMSRFEGIGHTPGTIAPPPDLVRGVGFYPEGHPLGPIEIPAEEVNPDYPCTLDMRRTR